MASHTQRKRGASGPGRVLIVADDPLVRALGTYYLQAKGYAVDAADSGAAAFRRLVHLEYDVVLADLLMPDSDGFEVLTAVQSVAPTTEVVLLTSLDGIPSATQALRLGAHDYITKPLTHAEDVVPTVASAVAKKRLGEANGRMLAHLDRLEGPGGTKGGVVQKNEAPGAALPGAVRTDE
jgi:two-component system response regulator HydG